MLSLLFIAAVTYSLPAAVVIDRIAVIVGKRIIKSSDIDRDLRITDFLNHARLVISPETKHTAAERLIDQAIIRDEISSGGYQRATDDEASSMLSQVRQSRYNGSEARFRQALIQYGITQDELQMELLWQLTVLKFIDERFRPGVLVSDEEVRDYYSTHLAALKKEYPQANSFETLAPKIRASLEGEQINQQFEMWLDDARKRTHVQYMQGAFQ